jgi:hypothetical protein
VYSALVEISDYGFAGIYLWLLESATGFEIYPLKSNYDFGFAHKAGISYQIADVTGDGIAEAITIHKLQPGGPGALTGSFDVFDLSQVPPRKLEFIGEHPFSGFGAYSEWSILKEGTNITLHFEKPLEPSFCPYMIISRYVWGGESFLLSQKQYPSVEELLSHVAPIHEGIYCAQNMLERMFDQAKSGDDAVINTLAEVIRLWPYTATNHPPDNSYPLDFKDEMRFRLAIIYAWHGDALAARQQFTTIVTDPVIPNSQWATQAQQFLEVYHSSDDLIDACAFTQACHPHLNFSELLQLGSTQPYENLPTYLENVGIPVPFVQTYDFDGDGLEESTILANQWIRLLVKGEDIIEDFYIGSLPSDTAVEGFTITPLVSVSNISVFEIKIGKYDYLFTFDHDSSNGRPEITRLYRFPSAHQTSLRQLADELLTGSDPTVVITNLFAIQQSPDFTCDKEDFAYFCYDLYLSNYLLGLAYELAGDEANAVTTYLQVWQDYPNSPYAVMARARLEPIP